MKTYGTVTVGPLVSTTRTYGAAALMPNDAQIPIAVAGFIQSVAEDPFRDFSISVNALDIRGSR